MNRKVAVVALGSLLASLALGRGRIEGSGTARRFVSQRYGFSITVPRGWYASVDGDTPMYVNFRSTGGATQLHLPDGGAAIVVVAQDSLPKRRRLGGSPRDWAQWDTRGVATANPQVWPFWTPKASGASRAVVTSYDYATYSTQDQAQHCVAIFWDFAHRLFAAHLNYVVGDPKGREFERTFRETIRSIRPLVEPKGKD